MRVAFVGNLDAECEWAATGEYRPSPRMRADAIARAASVRASIAETLDVSVDVVYPGDEPPRDGRYDLALCWSPTPRALESVRRLNAPLPEAPAPDVLRRVNHRAFVAGQPAPLPGERFVWTLAELDEALALRRPVRGHFLKRPFGFAGRGRKHLPADAALTGPARTWAEASMTEYGRGLQVEPRVDVLVDFVQHGFVTTEGEVVLGPPCRQRVDAEGRWLETVLAPEHDLMDHERRRFTGSAREIGDALRAAGYHGPYGVDGYRYVDSDGTERFHPRSEVNARLTMGFFVGMHAEIHRLLGLR